jgi:hypothetical protein
LVAVVATNIFVVEDTYETWGMLAIELAIVAILYAIAALQIVRGWDHASAVGERYPLLPGSSDYPTFSDSKRERARKLRQIKQKHRQEKLHVLAD